MKKRIPKFQSKEEAALFWENHAVLDYIDPEEFKVVHPEKSRRYRFRQTPEKVPKQLISLRVDSQLLARAKKVASRIQVGYQAVLRGWLERGASTQ